MRCRQCGKELPLFKKLADTEFCSAEHRESYVQEQQQHMLGALVAHRQRLKRATGAGRQRPALIDPNPAPAPVYGFLPQPPLIQQPAGTTAADASPVLTLRASIPLYAVAHRTGAAHAPIVPVRLELRSTAPRLVRLAPRLLAAADCRYPVTAGTAGRLSGWQRLFRTRPRMPKDAVTAACDNLAPAFLYAGPAPVLPKRVYPAAVVALYRTDALFRLAGPPALPLCGAGFELACDDTLLDATLFSLRPPASRLRVTAAIGVPEPLTRPARLRPRQPVSDARVPQHIALAPATLAGLPQPGRMPASAAFAGSAGFTETSPHCDAFRTAAGAASWQQQFAPAAAASLASAPATRATLPLTATGARLSQKLFAARPRAGVNGGAAGLYAVTPVALQPGVPARHGAGSDGRSECAPAVVSRLFRTRPRGGVSASARPLLAVDAAAEPSQTDYIAAPRLRSKPLGIAVVPPAINRPLRLRPRSGVPSGAVRAFDVLAAAPVCAAGEFPAGGYGSPAGAAALPAARLFMARPRRPVNGRTSVFAPLPAQDVPGCAAAVYPCSSPAVAELTSAGRLFRIRPRTALDAVCAQLWPVRPAPAAGEPAGCTAAAGSDSRSALSTPACRAASFAGQPAGADPGSLAVRACAPAAVLSLEPAETGGLLPAKLRGELVPGLSLRLYRSRPSRPVGAPGLALQAVSAGAPLAVYSRPAATPRPAAGAPLAPEFLDRAFRMRPRRPVGTQIPLPVTIEAAAAPFCPAGEVAALRATEPCLARLDRFFRMRPRFGVPSRSAQPGVRAFGHLSAVPLMAAPRTRLAACEPHARNDKFRMRPRRPVDAAESAWRALDSGPAEPAELYVMPPIPALHVVRIYRVQERDLPTRTGPPNPSAGSGGSGIDGPRGSVRSEFDAADFRKLARSRLLTALPHPAILPHGIHLPPPPALGERLLRLVRRAFLPRRGHGWLATPGVRFACCGAAAVVAVIVYAGSTGSVPVEAARPAETPLRSAVGEIRSAVGSRAAQRYADDFATGLHEWEGEGDWASTWTYDERGGVKPGRLAILKPAASLSDYTLEFMAQIERGALGFAVRAADARNYQAVKLVIRRPGPLPVVNIVRYRVSDGAAVDKVEKRLPVTVYNDTIYRIRLTAREDTYTLAVNGGVVDSWVDAATARGAPGFFAEKDERARVYDVRVHHQDDALGRMIAWVASDPTAAEQRTGKR